MNFIDALTMQSNMTRTLNGALTNQSTFDAVYDLFAFGGSYRNRSEEDCIELFRDAFYENETLAMKCLFYLRDCREGQGERRFFRICMNWLAKTHPEAVERNIEYFNEFGRYDDIYCLMGTPLEVEALELVSNRLYHDCHEQFPSLCAKWAPSINASSKQTRENAKKLCKAMYMTEKQYRQMLSELRERLKVLERIMSGKRWDEIDFSSVPSCAGLKYTKCFTNREELKERYAEFMKDKKTKVNALVLYPQQIAHKAFGMRGYNCLNPECEMLQKAWDNLPDYYCGRQENGLAVVDVSGSMHGTPLEAAVSLGAYIAEKAKGPFSNHFITFSESPKLVEFKGENIIDKFLNCKKADWGYNTNIEKVFDLILNAAKNYHTRPEDMPDKLYVFSDMEFDIGLEVEEEEMLTLIESIGKKWAIQGYKLPKIIFWNLKASTNNIPAIGNDFSYVSGFSPSMIECILKDKSGIELMLEKLQSDRYKEIE